jgi:dolichol-phosphate mannosyltransferase
MNESLPPASGNRSADPRVVCADRDARTIDALSVVIPVCNEAENVGPLALEVRDALAGRFEFELIYVDDGSTDGTVTAVQAIRRDQVPQVRLLRHARRSGQSAAVATGVEAARHAWIATLDGDGQNDPADIPRLVEVIESLSDPTLRMIIGHRAVRHDNWIRRMSSRVANGVRGRLLRDDTPDTGCGIKVFDRSTFLRLPRFDHMHRFLPALFQRAGGRVLSAPVAHRARTRGTSKYGLFDRLWVGISDMLGVMWLIRRAAGDRDVREE